MCFDELVKTETFDELRRLVSNGDLDSEIMVAAMFDGKDYDRRFKKWYADNYGKLDKVDFNGKDAKKLAKQIIEYWYAIKPDVNATARYEASDDKSQKFDYPSSIDRQDGKRFVAKLLLSTYQTYKDANMTIKGDKIDFYLRHAIIEWENIILDRASKRRKYTTGNNKKSKDELKKELDTLKAKENVTHKEIEKFIKELLGTSNPIVTKNLIAVWNELTVDDNDAKQYIREVFCNPKLKYVLPTLDETKDDEESKKQSDGQHEDNESSHGEDSADTSNDLDLDVTIALTDHSGAHSDFMMHIGERLYNYFNTLGKVISTTRSETNLTADTNNRFGIQDTLDAKAVSSILYSATRNFVSLSEAIKVIKDIAKNLPGYEALEDLATRLENDNDFAAEVMSVFAKTVMPKTQVRVNGTLVQIVQSNRQSNLLDNLWFNRCAELRNTIVDLDVNTTDYLIDYINKVITSKFDKVKQDSYDEVVANTVKLVKLLFPSTEAISVTSFINQNNDARGNINKQLKNVQLLVDKIKKIVDKKAECKKLYNDKVRSLSAARSLNRFLRKQQEQGVRIRQSSYASLPAIYNRETLSGDTMNLTHELAEMLAPYTVVPLQLNTPNVEGNNSSDVLNNNYITRIKKIFEHLTPEKVIENGVERTIYRHDALLKWGRQKLKSSQYTYSNILLEHTGPDGVTIPGIFRYINTSQGRELVLTEHASELLTPSLFDGATLFDENKNSTYSKMSEESYLPTLYNLFAHTEQPYGLDVKLGTFLCRTPSDAPKNFAMRMPIIYTANIFEAADPDYAPRVATEAIRNIPRFTAKNISQYLTDSPYDITLPKESNDKDARDKIIASLIRSITGTTNAPLWHSHEFWKVLDDGTEVINIRVNDLESGNVDTFIFKGKHVGSANKGIGFKIEGIVGYANNVAADKATGKLTNGRYYYDNVKHEYRLIDISDSRVLGLPSYLKEPLRDKIEELVQNQDVTIAGETYTKELKKINRDCPAYQALYNVFKQEMLDMAVALNYYFPMEDDGWISDGDTRKEKPNKVISLRNEELNKKGYKFYHLNKNGEVLTETTDKDGRVHYSLDGNVFHSTKFRLAKEVVNEETGEVETVQVNYLDDLITFERTGDAVSDEKINKKAFSIFYGAGNRQDFLHVVKDKNGNVTDVYFTNGENGSVNQEELVEEALDKFIVDYVDQITTELKNKSKFITGSQQEADYISFALNYFIFYNNCDDLFEGNTKFYIDAQTILKRAKEIQGSGVPYGIIDYLQGDEISNEEVEDSYLNNGTYNIGTYENPNYVSVQSLFEGTILEGVKQRYSFTGVTIANTKMTNHKALNILKNQLVKNGMSKERAMELLYGPIQFKADGTPKTDADGNVVRRGGFTETKVNDAQSYITLQEFVRRIAARGQLKRYMPLIRKLIDPDVELTANDLKEFVQVQKNFYYDQYYDKRYKMYVPRQIKNAEFVLVPKLIKGTELEDLYNQMIAHGIDQVNTVETSKAANEQIITVWDNDGIYSNKDFNERAEALSQKFSYNFLYTQQETPQHVNAQNKAGIQIVKKIIDNIPQGHPLYEKKMDYFKLFVENIRDSYNNVLDNFNIPRDASGNIILNADGTIDGLDLNVFYKKFKEELLRNADNTEILDFVTLDGNEPLMPSYFNNVLTKLEQVAQSIFNNNITRQKLPGFHAAQVTNVGWRQLSDVVNSVSYCKDLKYHPMQYKNRTNDTVISEREFELLDNEAKKQYDEIGPAGYIEVMLPYSALGIDKTSSYYKNKTDAEILAELDSEKLSTIIGYRIPTEGKQSVCNMKIVGFISDAYGSTIVVPNDWVSQTGSDFDIDSVYGIQYDTYKDADGKIRKIPYITKPTSADWMSYILRQGKRTDIDDEAKTEINKGIKKLRKEFPLIRQDIGKLASELLKTKLPSALRLQIKQSDLATKADYADVSKLERVNITQTRRVAIVKAFDTKDCTDEQKESIKEFLSLITAVANLTDSKMWTLETLDNPKIKKIIDDHISPILPSLIANGIMSYDNYVEYIKNNPEQGNSRRARNNQILDIMIDILSDPTSLEENLSRSNFDDIIYWRNMIMSENQKNERAYRSAYNVLDQVKYQQDATSGMALKGISVSLDTFCSVCNTVRPFLETSIPIVYDLKDYNITSDEDIISLVERFENRELKDEEKKALKGKTKIKIAHNKYGWSKDNRNIAGKLITAYSSQTTAHILDAIKEGNIPNVNKFSFPAYKTLVNMGSDYKCAISFIMQPGVSRIIRHQATTDSVYTSSYGNPVNLAIRDIAKELGVEYGNSLSIKTVLKNINDFEDENGNKVFNNIFNDLFNEDNRDVPFTISDNIKGLPIIVSKMVDRIKERGVFKPIPRPVEGSDEDTIAKYEAEVNNQRIKRLLFDLGAVLLFNNVNSIAKKTNSMAMVCNPDKFGAKQTIFATDKIFDDLHDLLYNRDTGKSKNSILSVIKNGEKISFLEAIYPGISSSTHENILGGMNAYKITDSSYPTLYAYLRYATATSSLINRQIFPTQSVGFRNAVKGITTVLSGFNPKIDEDLYKDVQTFILGKIYNDCDVIKYPFVLQYDKDNNLQVPDKPAKNLINAQVRKLAQRAREERIRVTGLGYPPGLNVLREEVQEDGKTTYSFVPFKIKDLNKPTNKELKEYAKLTPAQKVEFIQQNFSNPGVFGYYKVDMRYSNNVRRGLGTQTIKLDGDSIDLDLVHIEFRRAFFNNNPLVQMAALDIIKYATIVENFKHTNTGVTKTISDLPLLNEYGSNGTGFVQEVKDKIESINTIKSEYRQDKFLQTVYEEYLRARKDVKGLRTIYMTPANINKFKITGRSNGIYVLHPDSYAKKSKDSDEDVEAQKAIKRTEFINRMEQAGIIYKSGKDEPVANQYVRLKDTTRNTTILYRIHAFDNCTEIILTPLNNLEPYEASLWSLNEDNNEYASPAFYEQVVKKYRADKTTKTVSKAFKTCVEALQGEDYQHDKQKAQKGNVPARFFNLKAEATKSQGMAQVLETINANKYDRVAMTNGIYITNSKLGEYIFSYGKDYGSTQSMTFSDDPAKVLHTYIISKVDTKYINQRFLIKVIVDDKKVYALSDTEVINLLNTEKINGKPIPNRLKEIILEARGEDLQYINNLYIIEEDLNTDDVINNNDDASINPPDINTTEESQTFDNFIEDTPIEESYDETFDDFDTIEDDSMREAAISSTAARNVIYYINSEQGRDDKVSIEGSQHLRNAGLPLRPTEAAIERQQGSVNKILAEYSFKKANTLRSKFEGFVENPNDTEVRLSMTDPMLQDIFMSKVIPVGDKSRTQLLDEYMGTINSIQAFKEAYGAYRGMSTEGMSEDDVYYINQIKSAISIVDGLAVDEAAHILNEGYLSSISGNPLIKQHVLNIMDNFWKSQGQMYLFMDICQNGNPLMQTVLKDVFDNIEAHHQQARKYRRDYMNKVDDIKRRARRDGYNINFKKFVDKDGRLVQNYINEYVDKYYDLLDKINTAGKIHGYGSIAHIKAKLAFKKFKALYIEQPIDTEYYLKSIRAEEFILQYAPEVYEAYSKLHYRELDILDNMPDEGLSEHENDELRKIQRAIERLTSPQSYFDEDGNRVVRPVVIIDTGSGTRTYQKNVYDTTDDNVSESDVSEYWDSDINEFLEDNVAIDYDDIEDLNTEEPTATISTDDPAIYGTGPADILLNYLSYISKLNEKYCNYESKFGFEELLKRNLRIIEDAENRDGNGVPRVHQNILKDDEAYQRARAWIRKNARFVPVNQTEPTSIAGKLAAAFDRLRRGGNGRVANVRGYYKDLDVYDHTGAVNGTLLTDEQIAEIKSRQEANYGISGMPQGTDRILISSAPQDDNIYTREFYDKVKSNGNNNAEYFKLVTQLNKILQKYYREDDGIVHLEMIPDTAEGINELKQLGDLYLQLGKLKKYLNATNQKSVAKFIEETCEPNVNWAEYMHQKACANNPNVNNETKSMEYRAAFANVNVARDENGDFIFDDNGQEQPNPYLYSSLKVKNDARFARFIDEKRKEDLELVEHYTRKKATVYWYNALAEARRKRDTHEPGFDYDTWYANQHVYNPYTRKEELLDCWVTSELKTELLEEQAAGKWIPNRNQRTKVPNDGMVDTGAGGMVYMPSKDFRNPNYNPDVNQVMNYRKGANNGKYDSNIELNKYEIEMINLFKQVLEEFATTEQAKRALARGYLPRRRKLTENYGKRAAKAAAQMVGLNIEQKNNDITLKDLNYWLDRTPQPPMHKLLEDKSLGSEPFTLREPKRIDYPKTQEGFEQFVKEHEAWVEAKNEHREKELEINRKLLDDNWVDVIAEYIERASHHNAVLDSRNKLYYLLGQLRKQKAYVRKHGMYGDLKKDGTVGLEDEDEAYDTETDENLISAYVNLMRRILFDQWKESDGVLTRLAKHLQGYTSADYMMLNYRGGIANVTVGEAGIWMEAAAGEFIDRKAWGFGTKQWGLGSIGYIRGMYSETSCNKQDAIAKYFNVVDYDEIVGVNQELDIDKYAKRIRDFMFHPQHIGEHFMQNSVLFGMMKYNKLISITDDPQGIGYTTMTQEEYIRYKEGDILYEVLSEDKIAEFEKWKNEKIKDKNKLKEYAWWRRDLVTDFIYLHCSKDEMNKFKERRKEKRTKSIEEYSKLDNLWNQIELGSDGYMSFVEGSTLAKLDEKYPDGGRISAATKICSAFSNKVREVNKKIHGVYNRMGQAYIEKFWLGSLIMQYHKHLPMGLLKHFRARGYYNETRGAVDKGIAQSLWDFCNLNMDKVAADAGWNRDEADAVKALQFTIGHIWQFAKQISTTWSIIPEYEKGNIRRNMADLFGVLIATIGVIGLKATWDDDDVKDSIAYNLMLYEFDRTASEIFLYNPIGLWTESKTLMSQPIAGKTVVDDVVRTIQNLASWIMNGGDVEMTYQTGRFAGENKLLVFIERRTPIWNGIRGILDTPKNNSYYKIGSKPASIASSINHWIFEDDDD